MHDPIPFLDLVTPHEDMTEELVAVFRDALRTGRFIGGPAVEDFESEFATFCGTRFCVGVGSGTDALRFALIAAGVAPGSIVVTVPNAFIATTEAISQAGAQTHFIDIDEWTYTMDAKKLKEYLETQCVIDSQTGKTIHRRSQRPVSAVIPVHLYGQTADMDPISMLAEHYNLVVIEDACQAHGAMYFSRNDDRWKKAGSLGRAAAFSFYPGKNLGACGEAGAVTTDDEELARKVRVLRDHGQRKKYYHDMEGYNGRLDAIQAGILSVKLRRLPGWNEERRQLARCYNELFSAQERIIIPREPPWSRGVYHLYVIRTQRRDELQAFLAERNITTGLHYPVPLHLQKAYAGTPGLVTSLSVSERTAAEIISLPLFPGMTALQQVRVADALKEFATLCLDKLEKPALANLATRTSWTPGMPNRRARERYHLARD